ncbi:hypothetical protein EDB89DRAFT_1915305 [Lactarius sanguifluus]|nr:hypothetical protein EDB89DRAFT_1915305 [Lactarius sanguifluus]
MARENGVRAREAGGLVRPFPREWGATGWGRLALAYGAGRPRGTGASCPSCAPLPRGWEGWGRRSRALAPPFPAWTGRRALVHTPSARIGRVGPAVAYHRVPLSCAYRAARSKGGAGAACPRAPPFRASGAGGGVPSRTWRRGRGAGSDGEGGGVSHVLPSAQMGKGGAVGGVPSRAPFPRVRGGAANGKGGAGRDVRSCTPLLPEWEEWGRGSRVLAGPLSACLALARPQFARTGMREGGGGADAERWGGMQLCAPLPRAMGKGLGSRAPFPRVLPSHAPIPREWGGADKRERAGAGQTWRGGAVCPRTPPFRANGVVRTKGKGWGRGGRAPPFRANGKGRGRVASPCTGGSAKGKGEGPGAMCPHAPPFRANGVVHTGRREDPPDGGGHWDSGGQCGGGKEWVGDLPSFAPLPRKRWRRPQGGRERLGQGKVAAACFCAPTFRANSAARRAYRRGPICEGRLNLARGGKEGRGRVVDPVAEAKRACHVSDPLLPPPSPFASKRGRPTPLPIPYHHASPRSRADTLERGVHEVTRHHPLPLPGPSLSIRTEGVCTRTRHRLSPSPLAASPRAENVHTRACRPSPLPPSPSSFPFDHAVLYMRESGHATPGLTPPIRSEGGCMSARPARYPIGRATTYAREGCTRGHTTPGPTRAEGGRTRARRPGTSLRPRRPVRTGKGHAMVRDRRPHPSYSRGRGVHEGTPPCPHGKGGRKGTRPPAPPFPSAWKGRARGARRPRSPWPPRPVRADRWHARASRPHPVAPHSRGKGRTRPPASLRVAQQGRRDLRVPAFTAPSPRFRAP